jgi:threonyl-tRNA synthetase
MLVVGDDEAGNGTVSVRRRSGDETRGVALDDFGQKLAAEIAARAVEPAV